MMDITTMGVYFATMGIVGFFGVLLMETVDRKTDEMAGFRQRKLRNKKR